jgi:metal-responsive CopG/Arc/MetJ family transcriptional regulator
VVRGTDEAVSVAENIKETIKSKTSGERATRDNVVMVRVDAESLGKLDELVEAELAGSRSEAAAYLITEGIKARKPLFDAIAAKVAEIRKVKDELRELLDRDNTE